MAELAKSLQPHFSIPDVSKPYSVSSLLTLQSPSTSILVNYLNDKSVDTRPDECLKKFNFVTK